MPYKRLQGQGLGHVKIKTYCCNKFNADCLLSCREHATLICLPLLTHCDFASRSRSSTRAWAYRASISLPSCQMWRVLTISNLSRTYRGGGGEHCSSTRSDAFPKAVWLIDSFLLISQGRKRNNAANLTVQLPPTSTRAVRYFFNSANAISERKMKEFAVPSQDVPTSQT